MSNPVHDASQQPPRKKHKRIAFQGRWFTFTWNSGPDDWKDYLDERRSMIEKLVAGSVVAATTGTRTIHGWLKLEKKNNPVTWLELPDGIHWDLMSDTERKRTDIVVKQHGEMLYWGVPSFYRGPDIKLKPWQQEVWNMLQTEPHPRHIHLESDELCSW